MCVCVCSNKSTRAKYYLKRIRAVKLESSQAIMLVAKDPTSSGGCAGLSESSLAVNAILWEMLCPGSNYYAIIVLLTVVLSYFQFHGEEKSGTY